MSIHVNRRYLYTYLKVLLVCCAFFTAFQIHLRWQTTRTTTIITEECVTRSDLLPFDFSSSNNRTGYSSAIVPNIVHLIKFRKNEIDFVEMVNIRSIVVNHRPDWIYIHSNNCTDTDEHGRLSLRGRYWEMLVREGFTSRIRVSHLEEPTHVHGKALSSVFHASDVARIRILRRYGGMFLDNDIYVIQSLHKFRHYEMAIGWDDDQFLGTQVIVAHKDARFLKLWMESYQNYQGNKWYFNAGEYPTTSILYKSPELVHRVKLKFGVHMLVNELYRINWDGWRDYYTIHLLIRHRSYLDKESPIRDFNETNIKTYDRTYGQMVRDLLHNTTNLITEA